MDAGFFSPFLPAFFSVGKGEYPRAFQCQTDGLQAAPACLHPRPGKPKLGIRGRKGQLHEFRGATLHNPLQEVYRPQLPGQGKVRLEMRRNFSIERMERPWKALPGEMLEFPSPEVSKERLDVALSVLSW